MYGIRYKFLSQFKALGAKHVGISSLSRRSWSGEIRRELWYDIIYFFDDEFREIGYWSILSDYSGVTIFAPNYRQWGESMMNDLHIVPFTFEE
jgi:hypothetical protein